MTTPAPALLLADRVRKARHGSRCHLCRSPVRTGDHIGRVDGRWSHLACVISAQRATATVAGRPVVNVIAGLLRQARARYPGVAPSVRATPRTHHVRGRATRVRGGTRPFT